MQYSPEVLNRAIITQAANDFRSALKRKKPTEIRYFERWFLSDWGQALSGGCGEFIIESPERRHRSARYRELFCARHPNPAVFWEWYT